MSAFTLKILAIIFMFIDHFGAIFDIYFDATILRLIGRIAFPMFAFFIAEGCRHTRSIPRYILRLGIFAIITEPIFDLAVFNSPFSPNFGIIEYSHQNVFFTLALGVAAIWCYKSLTYNGLLLVGCIVFLAELLHTDYGGLGVLAIVLCYIFKKRSYQLIALFVIICLLYLNHFSMWSLTFTLVASISLLLLSFYNSKRGYEMKWFLYAFYPLHLLLLAIAVNIYGYYCKY